MRGGDWWAGGCARDCGDRLGPRGAPGSLRWAGAHRGVALAAEAAMRCGAALVLLGAAACAAQGRAGAAAGSTPPGLAARQMRVLLNSLPACSALLDVRIKARPGAPYMPLMREMGVARAYFVDDSGLIRRTYFRHLDGPRAIIRDPAWLARIVSSGLQAQLGLVLAARLDRRARFPSGTIDADAAIELFAQPFLRPNRAARRALERVGSFGLRLNAAISAGDGSAARRAIGSYRSRGGRLDFSSFLRAAVMMPYYDRPVIRALLAAGADPDTATGLPEAPTPLMDVLSDIPNSSPCNLAPLLAAGARLDIRNAAGQTPLDLAKKSGNAYAVHLIETALAQRRARRLLRPVPASPTPGPAAGAPRRTRRVHP
jgi:hypothetical protein